MNTTDICPDCRELLTTTEHNHEQVPVSDFGGFTHAHVDIGIADLIAACWSLGIWTVHSCQGDPPTDRAHLSFERGSAELFVAAATTENLDDPEMPEDVLGLRMQVPPDPDYSDGWTWQPNGWLWAIRFVALFPPGDIPDLTERLRRWDRAT